MRGIRTLEGANKFLKDHCIAEFNQRFTVPAAQRGAYITEAEAKGARPDHGKPCK